MKRSIFEAAKRLSEKDKVSVTIDELNEFLKERNQPLIEPNVSTYENMYIILIDKELSLRFLEVLRKTDDINKSILTVLFPDWGKTGIRNSKKKK